MVRRRFILLRGLLLAWATTVAGRNDFNTDFPTTFSFNTTTPFVWLANQDSYLASIYVIGDTNAFERLQLPLDPQMCTRSTTANRVTTCVLWVNNGTATFGGSYAATLVQGRLYHMVINYEVEADGSSGSSESPVFRMLRPLLPATPTGVPIRTESSSVSPTSPSTASTRLGSSTTTSPGPSPTTSTATTSTSLASAPTTATSPSPSPPPSSMQRQGLPPGATAGITIGVLSMIAIAFLVIFFRRRKRLAEKKALPPGAPQVDHPPGDRNTGISLEDIDITLGSPVTYSRVYQGRQGWHHRNKLDPLVVPRRPSRGAESQHGLLGSPF